MAFIPLQICSNVYVQEKTTYPLVLPWLDICILKQVKHLYFTFTQAFSPLCPVETVETRLLVLKLAGAQVGPLAGR